MLFDEKFDPTIDVNYNAKWGVVYNKPLAYDSAQHRETILTQVGPQAVSDFEQSISQLTEYIDSKYETKLTSANSQLRQKMVDYIENHIRDVYPGGHLLVGGSSTSRCGTTKADIDLCWVVRTHKPNQLYPDQLPIDQLSQGSGVNAFMLDRIYRQLEQQPEYRNLTIIPARVPLVKFILNTNVVDRKAVDEDIEFEVQCNCVAGIYNSYYLGGLVNYDDRLAKLAIAIKLWAKNVKVVAKNRYNSYTITLLIAHFLQCGINPPVLPNLIALQPEQYDGTIPPWDLTTEIDKNCLPEHENMMSVGELLVGFFHYYKDFNFEEYGILIRDASDFKIGCQGGMQLKGSCGSRVFVEEPYDGLTVPKNIKELRTALHIRAEFRIAYNSLLYNELNVFYNRYLPSNENKPDYLTDIYAPGTNLIHWQQDAKRVALIAQLTEKKRRPEVTKAKFAL